MPTTYKYAYPNWKSYQMIPPRPGVGLYNGQLLRHGYIYGYKETASVNTITGPSDEATRVLRATAERQLDYQNVMVFQFNPSNLPLDLMMMPADHPDSLAVGNVQNVAVGLATSSGFELWFDRTNEVARATMGVHGRYGETKWKELGVQADLFDLLKVISGGDKSVLAKLQEPDIVIDDPGTDSPVVPGSTNQLTGMLFDAVTGGTEMLNFKSFAIVFNPNLAVHVQRITGISYSYLRFTADLVPTMMKVIMNLEISNMGTKSYVTSGGIGGPLAPSTPPPGVNDGTASPTTGIVNAPGRVPDQLPFG